MAVVLPIVGAFEAVAAAGSFAGALTASVGSFLSVAGGVLTGIGALTGNKDLLSLGGLLGLGGGIAGALDSAAGVAAGEVAGEAAAGEGMKAATSSLDALRPLKDAANAPDIGSAIGQAAESAAEGMAGSGVVAPQVDGAWWQQGQASGGGGSLMERAALGQSGGGGIGGPGMTARLGAGRSIVDPVMQAGKSMSSDQLQALLGNAWDKTKQLASGAGQFVKENKDLVSLAGGAIQGMYGPQAEQMDMQRSIMARRLRNMNSQVRLGRQPVPGRM